MSFTDYDVGDPRAKVYIGDLGSSGSKSELEKEFEKFGRLKSVWVARNPPGNLSQANIATVTVRKKFS